jgi:hypothetical protein
MKRPETVKVGPYTYEIVWDDRLGPVSSAMGATNEQLVKLFIDPTNDEQAVRETLVHEVLHAIWKQTSLLVRFPDGAGDSDGETIIQDLAPRIFALLLENREVVKWIQG